MRETNAVLPPAPGAVKAYSRGHVRQIASSVCALSLAMGACVSAPEGLADGDLDRLEVEIVHPDADAIIDGRSPLVVRLDGPWDPLRSNPDAFFTVTSGSIRMYGQVETSLTDLEMRFVPIEPWREGLTWTVSLNAGALRGLDGRSALVPDPTGFSAVPAEGGGPADVAALSFSTDVAPLLTDCASCHDGEGLVALTADALVDQHSSSVPDRWLVLAGEPERSVLLNKLVDAPVARFGTVMPPPWSEQPRLSRHAVRTIEAWIEQGALP